MENIKVSYISDLHLDFYISPIKNKKESYLRFINELFGNDDSEILVVAGDIGHYDNQNIIFFQLLSSLNIYKHIYVVLGNHDYYLVSNNIKYKYKNNSLNRIEKLKNGINNIDNVTCLDGDIVEYKNKIIAGLNGFYDGSYYFKLTYGYGQNIVSYWKTIMSDAKLIKGITDFYDLAKIEKAKYKKIFDANKEIDLMISHIVPLSESIVFPNKYKSDPTSAFYCFDGIYEIEHGKVKNYIFGHIHDVNEFEVYDTKFYVNAFGYPKENIEKKLKQIII